MIRLNTPVNSQTKTNHSVIRLLLVALLFSATAQVMHATDLLTERYDNARSGQNQSETILNHQNVNSNFFGRLFSLPTDGQVFAQTLYKAQVSIPQQGSRNVLYVATEHGSVYAFDADGNNPPQGYLWKVSFINPANGVAPVLSSDLGNGDISPEITITGTPVIDASSNTMYVVAQTKEGSAANPNFVFRLHALDITTGAEKMNGPSVITASVPGTGRGSVNGTLTMDNLFQNQRAGLALVKGVVYIPFGSHGDLGNFHGWVLGYNAANVQQQVGKFVTTPNGWGGGIWMGGGAISSDNAGNLYVGSGNGQFGDNRNGAGQENYADSLIRLSTNGGLTVGDSFTPADQQSLENSDGDMGVSDLLVLPDQPGVYPHLLVSADKPGALFLVNRDGFGGFNASMNTDVQTIQTGNSIHNSVSYFNNTIYVGNDGAGVAAYPLQNGLLAGVPQSVTANIFGTNNGSKSGTSPVITANGTSNGIVWAVDAHSGNAILYAYDASNLANMLYNSNQALGKRDVAGPAVKFSTPTAVNGKIYVEGTSGVTVYGLLSDVVQTTATPVFNPAPGKIFNNAQGVAVSDATPNATIHYTTDGSNPTTDSPTYSSPVQISGPTTINAFATAPSLNASPTVSAFYTVQSNTAPPVPTFGSGFTNAGLALNGSAAVVGGKLQLTDGGANEVSSVFYTTPVNVQRFTTQFLFQLNNPNGEGFTFTLQNSGLAALGSPAGGLGFGPDPNFHVSSYEYSISNSVAVKFDLANTSGEGVNSTGIYINGTSPAVPAINLSNTGIDLHSGDTFLARLDYDGANLKLTLTDTNNPAKTYSTTVAIDIPGTIGSKTAYAGFTGSTGSTTAIQNILQWNFNPLPNFGNGFTSFGLALNGTAAVVGSRLRLTDGDAAEAASAYYATPLNIQQFTTDFQFQLSNAQADGFTFVIQRAGASAIGANGGGLGYAPNIGNSVAVKFDLFSNAGEGPDSTGLYINGAFPTVPSVDLLSHGIDLHGGDPFQAQLSYDGRNLTLTITDVSNSHSFTTAFPIDIPGTIGGQTAYVGFTAGAGGSSATQEIVKWNFNPGATSGPPPPPPPAAAPVFNPPSGTVLNGTQPVSLSDATANATIYYTTNGSIPSTSSAKYSGPIQISGPTTINAFATAPGDTASSVASASYTVQTGTGSGPSFGNGFTSTGLTLNGGASVVGSRLQLTDGGSSEARSAFYSTPVNIQKFTTDFQFQDKNAQGDGFTFAIQGQGPNAVGWNGASLGYSPGIGKSVAVKFDLYSNAGEGTSSTGFYLNGALPTLPSVDMLSHGIDLHNGDIFAVHLVYDGSNLTLTITDTNNPAKTFTVATAVNIPATVGGNAAYVGFTAGTGGATAVQQIVKWTFTPGSAPPVTGSGPSFGNGFTTTGLTFNGVASVVGTRLQLTDGGSNEATSAFYSTPVNIQQFTTDFQFQDTNAQGDGFTFTIQGQGPAAVGWNGASLGYGPGINNSVAVKFDLYSNAGEGTSSTGFYLNGAFPTVPSVDMLSHGIDLHNGDVFAVHLVYDGSTLALTVTDTGNPAKTFTTVTSINIPATVGGNTAYVGFTGGSGGATAVQQIVRWTFNPGSAPPVTGSGPSFGNGFTNAGLTFNGVASVVGTRLQLTDGGSNEATSAFYATQVNIQHFTTDFQFQDINAQGDGFTFTIQGQGPNAVGWNGGALGYGPGINNSVAVKFDLYSNNGEGTSSTGFYLNGAPPNLPSVDMLSHGIDLHNGDIFAVHLVYDGSNLTLTITDTGNPAKTFTTATTVNIPGTVGGNTAYVGFTAGTGGATATQQIVQWTFGN